jgi:tRNA(Ile)-lysidine synthase
MLAQLADPARDARIALSHDGAVIGVYAGRIVVHAPTPAPFERAWQGEAALELPHGRLAFSADPAAPMRIAPRAGDPWIVRLRRGGERLALAADAPGRSLKTLMQHARMPAWERDALPLLFCGEALAAAPGIGVDARFRAAPGSPGLALRWQPFETL